MVGSTGAKIVTDIKSANAQTSALREQMAITKKEAGDEASAELFDRMREGRREAGKVRAQAGESGLSLTSGSVEALLLDSAMQTELSSDRTLSNLESRHRANIAEAGSLASRIQKPTVLGAGLQLGAAAASAYSGVSAAKIAPTPKSGS